MKRLAPLVICIVFVVTFTGVATAAKSTSTSAASRDFRGYHFAQDGAENVLTSGRTSGVRFKANASSDTFCLYGRGQMNLCGREGRFDDGSRIVPQTLNHNQGCDELQAVWPASECWLGIDRTDQPAFWQIVPNPVAQDPEIYAWVNGLGIPEPDEQPQNHAAWAGQSSTQEPGWTHTPGYGNNWNAILEWKKTLLDPSVPQVVGLDFYFHHDSEPAYDFFEVQYDSAGTTIVVYSVDGSNAPFGAPGVHYPLDVVAETIEYRPNAYGGELNDEIILEMEADSDGAWSDEDGLWPTYCGFVMVDDITVTYSEGTTYDNFDSPTAYENWRPAKAPFAGDFSYIHPRMTDLDVCRENMTPLVAFLDFGQCPVNGANNCGNPPCQSTGGSQSSNWNYGIPGGWVNNFNGGLSNGLADVLNEVWSPPIDWDVPGTADDAADVAGAFLSFSVWRHLPLLNGFFYVWQIRSSDDGVVWSPFFDRLFVYFSNSADWQNNRIPVSDLINGGAGQPPHQVQIAFGTTDLASLFAFPGTDATPAPAFDNVALCKYRLQGPVFATRNIDLFMDSFPQSGNHDWATLTGRQDSDCRIDTRDVSSGVQNTPGDSVIVDITSAIPGLTLDRVEIKWVLDKNPLFEDTLRDRLINYMSYPEERPVSISMSAGTSPWQGWDQWFGVSYGDTAKVVGGTIVQDRFFFDLPDENFAHPGDVVRYYIEAEDSGGNISTLPADIDGFATGRDANGQRYPDPFTLHMLPSVVNDGLGGLTQPRVLVWNDFGFRGGLDVYYQAFESPYWWRRGIEWDMFTTWGPTSSVSNGLGSAGAHGATADQIDDYEAIVYFVGDLGTSTMSDGSDSGNNDKGDDLALMQGWFHAPGKERYVAHFGDDIVDALLTDSPTRGGTYVSTVMGVSFGDHDVKDEIDNQSAPLVVPSGTEPCFMRRYVAYGGCLGPNDFDSIDAIPGLSTRSHEFLSPHGVPYGGPNRAASVASDQGIKKAITFPYGFVYVWNDINQEFGGSPSARSVLLDEVIQCYFQIYLGGEPLAVDGETPDRRIGPVANHPNPFNPSTTLRFAVGVRQNVSVKMYNIRGGLVATLHEGPMEAGPRELVWQGTDGHGISVASGVYIARIEGEFNTRQIKTLLVK